MKAGEVLAVAATALGAVSSAVYIAWYLQQKKCNPPTGGCPPGKTYDYTLCQCTSSGGGEYTVDFYVEGPSGPIADAVGLLDSVPSYSDSSGLMTFSSVSAGTHLIQVSASGYKQVSEQVGVSASQTTFTVTLGSCSAPSGGCPCGSGFSASACQCVKQQIGGLLAPPSLTFDQDWYVHVNEILQQNTVLCGGTTPGGDPGCGGKCGQTEVAAQVAVQVVDAEGAPVCGVQVQGFLSQDYLPWTTSDGKTWGHFAVSTSPSLTTGRDGVAAFNVIFEFVVDGTAGTSCLAGCCGPSVMNGQDFNVVFSTQVAGTAYKAATTLSMTSRAYAYYYL